ncbi:MAG TPA: hypothetical protein VH413_07720 [Verrucomicrobiae bacterium]|jgi:hypothetical protein|nr:hypothetical protein [Verrucomicrobiae bacterium]
MTITQFPANSTRRTGSKLAAVLLPLSLALSASAYPVFQDAFNSDPQFEATSSTEQQSITATNADDLFTVSAWADQAATVPAGIYQYFLFIGVDSGVGNGALIDGNESMTTQLFGSVGASMIEFNYTGGSGGVTNNLARVHISGFKSDPVASAVVYSSPKISNISYTNGVVSFDCASDNNGNDYSQLLFANPASSSGSTLTISGEPSPNGDATGWFVGYHQLNIQEAVAGPQLSPTQIPQNSTSAVTTDDGALTVKGFSDLNATAPANLGRYYDQCFGIATGNVINGNASITLSFTSGNGLSRLDSLYSGGHLAISGFLSDPGFVDAGGGATSSGYTNGVLTIAVADGGFHPYFFTNRAASAGQTLRMTDTDSQFGVALVGYANIHSLIAPDLAGITSPTYTTPDGLLSLAGFSDNPGTQPANLFETYNWFGISGGNNTQSVDGTETLNVQLASTAALSGFGTKYTSGQINIAGFTSDPGFSDPSGVATGANYANGILNFTLNAPQSPEIVMSFTNLSASAGQTLTFYTDGSSGSQLTLSRLNYASIGSAPLNVSIAQSGTNVIVTWPSGTLQQSANALTGFSDVTGATSPYTNAISGTKFFRVKGQ